MKRSFRLFLISLATLVCWNPTEAQVIRGAVMGGMTLTQVDGDEVYGFHKVGGTLGAAAIVPLGEQWSVSIATDFIQKGSYQKPQVNDSLTYEYRLRLDYLEVPLLLHFTDKDVITAGAGFSWARLVRVEEYEHALRVPATTLLGGPYERSDFSIVGDLRFRVSGRWHFSARYSYSLGKIRTREFVVGDETLVRDQFNNVIAFRMIYIFNEAREKGRKKE